MATIATQFPPSTRTTLAIDPAHSSAEFAVRHLMVSTVKGRFNVRSGTIVYDPDDPTRSSVAAEVDVASVDTGMEPRDAHLRSPDFFDAANHPVMTFRSTAVRAHAEDRGEVDGDLTIRGVTRPVTFRVELDGVAPGRAARRVGLIAETTIDRKQFGLAWNQILETGGVAVGDKVRITLHLAAEEVS